MLIKQERKLQIAPVYRTVKNNNRLVQLTMAFYHHQVRLHANMAEWAWPKHPISAAQAAGPRSAVISVSVCLTGNMSMHNCSFHSLAVRRLLCLQEFFPQNYLNLTGFPSCIYWWRLSIKSVYLHHKERKSLQQALTPTPRHRFGTVSTCCGA